MHDGQFRDQAAVLIAISENSVGQEQVLLTKRAEHLSLHRGEVAFPGGKWEPQDSSLMDTALRESHEEVDLLPSRVSVIETLPKSATRGGMWVTPFVGRLDSCDGLNPNPEELDALFWVPMEFLLADKRVRTDIFSLNKVEYWAPVYHWEGFEIWGFTARVIVNFLNRVYGCSIARANPAPEIPFRKKIEA